MPLPWDNRSQCECPEPQRNDLTRSIDIEAENGGVNKRNMSSTKWLPKKNCYSRPHPKRSDHEMELSGDPFLVYGRRDQKLKIIYAVKIKTSELSSCESDLRSGSKDLGFPLPEEKLDKRSSTTWSTIWATLNRSWQWKKRSLLCPTWWQIATTLRRADIICFAKNIHPSYLFFPLLVVECKGEKIKKGLAAGFRVQPNGSSLFIC